MNRRHNRSGFTLVELLAAVAILVIVLAVVILIINPAQLIAQSHDANRLRDLATMNTALNFYVSDQTGASNFALGTSTNIYVSIPDSSSTCGNLGLPTPPSGYSYACAPTSTYRNVSSTGWIPINFNNINGGSPFGAIPIDPLNQTSSGFYYTYYASSSQFEVTAIPESAKQRAALGVSPSVPKYPGIMANGSNVGISPLWNVSGLVGYWPLNEGSGTAAYDLSGLGGNGTWGGSSGGQNGTHYSAGKVGNYAGTFDGSTNYVDTALVQPTFTTATFIVWMDPSQMPPPNSWNGVLYSRGSPDALGIGFRNNTGQIGYTWDNNNGSTYNWASNLTPVANTWNFVALVINTSSATMYLGTNGVLTSSTNAYANIAQTPVADFYLGADANATSTRAFKGLIDDARIYNRAFSPAEVTALYNAEK